MVNSSTDLFSLSELLVLKSELKCTLALVEGQTQVQLSGVFFPNIPRSIMTHLSLTERSTIDLTDWDSSSDEEREDGENDTDMSNAAVGKHPAQ